MLLLTRILSLCLGVGTILDPVRAKVACTETSTCESALRPGSVCADGYCTNPFARGCLNNFMGMDPDSREKYPKIRTCNSDDGPDAPERGLCAASPLDYEEVRLGPNNWESAMFYGWILQILLSEVLDVPATIDTGPGGGALSFYDVENSFAYPKKANNFDALYKANEVGDCRNSGGESCAHMLTEVWQGKRELNESAVEREGNGMVGHVGWFINTFAAKKDASLTHYFGLIGEENRQK